MKAKVKNANIIVEVEKTSTGSYSCKELNIVFRKQDLDFNISAPEKVVLEGWVCRDEDGTLNFFFHCDRPKKQGKDDYWSCTFGDCYTLPESDFPSITWESDPRKARIEITLIDEKGDQQ